MAVEVKTLEGFGRDRVLRIRWLKMWNELAVSILRMPEWLQNIVLEDIQNTVRNRIAVMEMIQKCVKK